MVDQLAPDAQPRAALRSHDDEAYGEGAVYEFATSPDAINGPPPLLRSRAGTDNIFDFKNWGPRLGVSYMLTADGKTVVRGSHGRYYQPLSVESLRRFGPDMPLVQRTTQFFQVGPWSSVDTNSDGEIDELETRAAARRVHGLTPISVATDTNDPSWTLNVADNLKNQHTDHFTLNFQREVARNLSFSASPIHKRAGNLFSNIPINEVTGQPWEYERIPFTTSSGEQVMLYSVAFKDYNGDGELSGADVAWIEDNNASQVQNMPEFDGVKPSRTYQGVQFVLSKRHSERWQGLASVLFSNSKGISRRSFRQDFNVEAPMFYDDNWMGNINYTIHNLEGPLPFTPRFELKLSGSYTVPKLEADIGIRYRMHSGRAIWRLEDYPVHTSSATRRAASSIPPACRRLSASIRTTPTICRTSSCSTCISKRPSATGPEPGSCPSCSTGSTSSTPPPRSTRDVVFDYGRVTAIPTARRFRAGVCFELI